ncbi:MAG: hypothetical protein DLM68_03400 [Hyphomicrobiales bacterium]|nr:MAG: hypothetical protein DLM68_03400 [Hyphomicrobiales bacterium]
MCKGRDSASAWRAAAASSDARIARGEARPLDGLPVTIKRGCGHGDLRGYSRAAKLYPERRCEHGGPAVPGRSDPPGKTNFPFSPASSRPATTFTGRSPIRMRVRSRSMANKGPISI